MLLHCTLNWLQCWKSVFNSMIGANHHLLKYVWMYRKIVLAGISAFKISAVLWEKSAMIVIYMTSRFLKKQRLVIDNIFFWYLGGSAEILLTLWNGHAATSISASSGNNKNIFFNNATKSEKMTTLNMSFHSYNFAASMRLELVLILNGRVKKNHLCQSDNWTILPINKICCSSGWEMVILSPGLHASAHMSLLR